MILPIWLTLLPLAVFAASGAALDRFLGLELGRGAGKWPRWAACGLVACFAAALHPLVLAALVALAVGGRVAQGRPPWQRGRPLARCKRGRRGWGSRRPR